MAEQPKSKDFRQTKAYRALRKDLLTSLEARGLDQEVYLDKVREYLDFWVRLQKLNADADLRGLTVTDDRGRQTENRSVSLSVQVSKQMLALFNALGFKPGDFAGMGGDDEL